MSRKKALGRGLGALIEDPGSAAGEAGRPLEVPVAAIAANPLQPRARMDPKELRTLADSIRDRGLLEPLLVRRLEPDRYELIAGERRLRAARAAGLAAVPVMIREAEGVERLELALIENLHREDLNAIEEGESYRRLQDEFQRSLEDLVRLSGRDRTTVTNLIRLLQLPAPVQEDVRQGRLSAGHARALLALVEPERILRAREQVLAGGLSVRETEALVKRTLKGGGRRRKPEEDQAYFDALAAGMTRSLGLKVKVVKRGRRGRVEIHFSSNAEIERLLGLLGVGPV